jgi:hypothetical protein
MGKLFINYRRADSAGHAGRVHDRLKGEFGDDVLFMDVATIPLGVNFAKYVSAEVAKCDVLLVLIGPNWIDVRDSDGNRRLDNPNDLVRLEIATALMRDIPVIPILIDGAKMPKPEQLPADIRELAMRNGLDVRHASFQSDIDKLIGQLKRTYATAHDADIDARDAFFQILESSEWRERQLSTTVDRTTLTYNWLQIRLATAIHKALRNSELQAWGEQVLSRTADTPEKPIPADAWDIIEIDFDRSAMPRTSAHWKVASQNGMSTAWAGVKFSRNQVFGLFPPARSPQAQSISDWRPMYRAVEHVRGRIGDADATNFWPRTRRALRQAAYDGRVKIRGRKQLPERSMSKSDYSEIHTDIEEGYWEHSEINVLASSSEEKAQAQALYHVDPQTAFAWGPLGMDERKRYAELLVCWADVVREWP